jgi:PTS system mannose-specific IIA component
MNNGILIIAHAPLASALRAGVLHVFADNESQIAAVDVLPNASKEVSRVAIRDALTLLARPQTLLLTDIVGATPFSLAREFCNGNTLQLIAGVNLPMLMRAMTYRSESLESLVQRALQGGVNGIELVAPLPASDNSTFHSFEKARASP